MNETMNGKCTSRTCSQSLILAHTRFVHTSDSVVHAGPFHFGHLILCDYTIASTPPILEQRYGSRKARRQTLSSCMYRSICMVGNQSSLWAYLLVQTPTTTIPLPFARFHFRVVNHVHPETSLVTAGTFSLHLCSSCNSPLNQKACISDICCIIQR